jgi:hypothetical protein
MPSQPMPRKHNNRATEFEAVLSKSRIGSLPETGELVLEAVEQVAAGVDAHPILVTELLSRAIARVAS